MSPSLQTALAHDDAVDESRKRYRFLVVKKALKDFRRELYALKDVRSAAACLLCTVWGSLCRRCALAHADATAPAPAVRLQYLKYNHSCVSHALKFLEKRTHASFREQFLRKHRASYVHVRPLPCQRCPLRLTPPGLPAAPPASSL